MATKPIGHLAVVLAAAGAVAGVTGCDGPTPDEIHAGDFGYNSIRRLQVDVRHEEAGLGVRLLAELLPSGADTCPTLDPDFTITANGAQPARMGLDPNDGDAFVLFQTCRIHQLDAGFTLPADTRSVRLDFSQRTAGGVVELAIPEQTTMQLGALSATSVPMGGTFTADVTLTPTPAGRIGGGSCWYGGHCPRDNPSCVPGEGYSGLIVTESQPNDRTIHLEAQVPEGSFAGQRAMFLATSSFFGCLEVPLPISDQTVGFATSATVDVKDPGKLAFDFDVTSAGN